MEMEIYLRQCQICWHSHFQDLNLGNDHMFAGFRDKGNKQVSAKENNTYSDLLKRKILPIGKFHYWALIKMNANNMLYPNQSSAACKEGSYNRDQDLHLYHVATNVRVCIVTEK